MAKYLTLKLVLLIALFSFLLQFIWEWLQCEPFFFHRGTKASPVSMLIATLGDVGLTFLILGLVLILTKEKKPFMQIVFRIKTFVLIEIISFLVAFGIEKFALATKRWSYTQVNPIIPFFEVSFLPVLQLMLIIPVVLFSSMLFLRKT